MPLIYYNHSKYLLLKSVIFKSCATSIARLIQSASEISSSESVKNIPTDCKCSANDLCSFHQVLAICCSILFLKCYRNHKIDKIYLFTFEGLHRNLLKDLEKLSKKTL